MAHTTASTISTSGSRGRPRSFDVDAVADIALRLFWEQGLEATSLEQITARTGVSASSLYAAYGNKRGLFRAAVDRYRIFVGAAPDALAHGGRGIDDVMQFVDWVRRGITSGEQPPGCLIVNTMVELGPNDPETALIAASYRRRIRSSLRHALRRAERAGEIAQRTSPARSLVVEASLFGALVTGEADAMLRSLTTEIRRWRV